MAGSACVVLSHSEFGGNPEKCFFSSSVAVHLASFARGFPSGVVEKTAVVAEPFRSADQHALER